MPRIRPRRAVRVVALGGLRPDSNGLPLVPAEGLGLWPGAACTDAEGASVGGAHCTMKLEKCTAVTGNAVGTGFFFFFFFGAVSAAGSSSASSSSSIS